MGEPFGIPEWLAATVFVVAGVSIWFAIAWRNTKRQIARTLARRANPSRAEFLKMMAGDVSDEAAAFLWETIEPNLDFHNPNLAPHPDDDLVSDLPIDGDDIRVDWPREWAAKQGFHESNLPDWPDGWPVTIRNYGRWLDMGPVSG